MPKVLKQTVTRSFSAATWGAATLVATFVATALPSMAHAQALPDARAVLARYAQVTNAAKMAAAPGYHVKGTFSLPAAGLSGPLEGFTDRLGRTVQAITIAGIGEIREGADTSFAWSVDPIQGPKLIVGKEYEESRERRDPRAMRRDPALVVGAQTLERATVDSQPCVKVKLTWKSGRVTTDCYSESTGLLVSSEGTQSSSMGDIAFTTSYSGYKTFDGVTMPTKTIQRAAGTEVTILLTEVTFGPIDAARLALPPEIQALRAKAPPPAN